MTEQYNSCSRTSVQCWWVMGCLGAECREGALVVGVNSAAAATWCTTTCSEIASIAATTTAASTSLTIATELASVTTTSRFATSGSTTTTASATTVARVGGRVVLTIEVESVLVLLSLLLLLLGLETGEEILGFALDLGTGRELLLGAFVGLAGLQSLAAERHALLGQIGQILVVRLGLVLLGLGRGILANSLAGSAGSSRECGIGARGIRGPGVVLGLGVGNGIASLLVRPLRRTGLATPAVSHLLLVLAEEEVSCVLDWFMMCCAAHPTPEWFPRSSRLVRWILPE